MNQVSRSNQEQKSARGPLAVSLRRSKFFSSLRRRSGGAVLEAVLVLPILLGLSLAVGEYGLFFYYKHNLVNAARAGVRAAIPSGADNAAVIDAVRKSLFAAGMVPNVNSSGNYTIDITNTSDVAVTVST